MKTRSSATVAKRLEEARQSISDLYEEICALIVEIEYSGVMLGPDLDCDNHRIAVASKEMFRVYMGLRDFCNQVCRIDEQLEFEAT